MNISVKEPITELIYEEEQNIVRSIWKTIWIWEMFAKKDKSKRNDI